MSNKKKEVVNMTPEELQSKVNDLRTEYGRISAALELVTSYGNAVSRFTIGASPNKDTAFKDVWTCGRLSQEMVLSMLEKILSDVQNEYDDLKEVQLELPPLFEE